MISLKNKSIIFVVLALSAVSTFILYKVYQDFDTLENVPIQIHTLGQILNENQ